MRNGYRRVLTGLLVALCLMRAASAQPPSSCLADPRLARPTFVASHLPGEPAPLFPKIAAAVHSCHQPVPVPPNLEIEVLDPNVDPRGNPTVLTYPVGALTPTGPAERLMVDIPPTVLVHRYYYTGDRSFQGPMLPGGPSVVVLNHPKTGERLYVPVQMLPGAPRVTYTSNAIEYDYGTQAITISFCWLSHKPKVDYRQGMPAYKKIEHVVVRTGEATRELVNRTGLPEVKDTLVNGTKNVVVTTADRVNTVGKQLLAPPTAMLRMTPLGNLFTSSEEDQAIQARNEAVQRASAAALRAQASIPTNR